MQAKKKIMDERREARRAVMAAREMESTLRAKMESVRNEPQASHQYQPSTTLPTSNPSFTSSVPRYVYPSDENSSSLNRGAGGSSSFRGPAGWQSGKNYSTLGTLEEVDDFAERGAENLVCLDEALCVQQFRIVDERNGFKN